MPHRRRSPEEEEQQRQERLAYVGALAAGLVHEVRTPLHAIQLNAQLLAEMVDELPPEQARRIERRTKRIYTEVKALTKTLEQFLTFARPPKPDPTPTDLNHFLRELIEFVTPEFEEDGIEILADLAPDMYPVVLDQRQFTHVILNLLRNAREAIEERESKEARTVDGWVRVSTEETETTVSVKIEDNGVGIRPEEVEQIFEIFHTTKAKGTGLGLGIVRRIVEDHRGTITVETRDGPGVAFLLTLPRGRFLEFRED